MIDTLVALDSLAARLRRRVRARGQSLVEFALVFPVFIFLLFTVIDGGRFVFANSAVSNAAREGARLASVEASWRGSADPSCGAAGGPVCPANDGTLLTHVTSAANRQMSPFGSVSNVYMSCAPSGGTPPTGTWTGSTCGSPSSGGRVSVRVTYTWRAITPVISNILGAITTSGSSTVVIN
jgi:Flp pilus assembly protein TadG